MELSRRDVLSALSAASAGAVAGCSAPKNEDGAGATDANTSDANGDHATDATVDDHDVDTLVALGVAVYPSGVEGVEGFVREYSAERVRRDPAYEAGVVDAVARLDEYVGQFYSEPYADLSRSERLAVLEQLSVDDANPVPDGEDRERIRYYLVNELLYAFYATPTGASLAGLENPPGHPGGTASYQRGPNA
ncbi:MAG: gluconate 2-dehydrogenase subunit 3 family protein [Halopenitus sp.]